MTVDTIETAGLDIFSEEILADPYPAFTQLREQAAVVHLPNTGNGVGTGRGVWALTRYDEIRDALADPATFSSRSVAFNDTMNEVLEGATLTTDPPHHAALRAALTANLSPRALRPVKPDIDAKVDAVVAGLVERGTFDAVDDLARAVPVSIVADLIGVQGQVKENFLTWGVAAFDCLGPMNERTGASFPVAGELFGWAQNAKAEDLVEGSIGRAIFDAAGRGEIPYEAAGMIIHQYVAAGVDSTIAAIGNALWLLARHPEQLALLNDDPSLVPAAFNEALRHETPVPQFGRYATRDVEVAGTLIPAGSQVAVLFAAGNRDPRHYPDPDVFDVRRNPTDHLSFGYDTHTCAGQGLARLEAHAVLTSLARRVRHLEVGEPVRLLGNMVRALDSLPVLSLELTRA